MPAYTLEATLVCIVMFAAVTLVSTVDLPPPTDEILHRDRVQRALQSLRIAQETSLAGGTCDPGDRLESLVISGVPGSPTEWLSFAERHFDDSLDVSLALWNGHGVLPLHGSASLRGASADVHYLTDLTYSLPIPALSTYSGTEAMQVAAPAVRNSMLVRPKGEAIAIQVNGATLDLAEDASAAPLPFTARVTGITAVGDTSDALLSFHDEFPLVGNVVSEGGELAPFGYDAIVSRTGPGATRLTLTYPPTWIVDDAWTLTWAVEEDVPGRLTVSANAATPLAFSATFTIPHEVPTRPFDTLHARLGSGSLAESSLVVVYPQGIDTERDLPRTLHPTIPYPLSPGQQSSWGVVLANAGPAVTIDEVVIEIPGGYDLLNHEGTGAPIFDVDAPPNTLIDPRIADAQLSGNAAGTWTIESPRLVRWTGSRTVEEGQAEYWLVGLTTRDDPTLETAIEPADSNGPAAHITFPTNGYTQVGSQWGRSPGIVSVSIPPASLDLDTGAELDNGYPVTPAVHDIDSRLSSAFASLAGEAEFRQLATGADLTNVQSAVSESYIEVEDRVVELGENAVATAYLDSLVTTLAGAGVTDATITTELYSPITRGCPTFSRESPLSAFVGVEVTDVLVWDGGTGVPSVFAGASDGFVHRMVSGTTDLQTPPAMSVFAGARVNVLAGAQLDAEPTLLAGLEDGRVIRLDPLTGAEEGLLGTMDGPVAHIVANGTTGRILIADATGRLSLYASTGAALAHAGIHGEVLQVEQVASGDIYAMSSVDLRRFSADLATLAAATVSDAIGFAVGETVLVADTLGYHSYRLDDLVNGEDYVVPGLVPVLAAHGDVTDDGVHDLVLAGTGNVVGVISGATERHVHTYHTTSTVAFAPFTIHEGGAGLDCRGGSAVQSYVNALHCGYHLATGGPAGLSVHDQVIAFAYEDDGSNVIEFFSEAPAPDAISLPAEDGFASFAWGDWLGPGAYAYGTKRGYVAAYDATGLAVASGTPSGTAGSTKLIVPIPAGGFLGSHLVVARIEWDESGKTQAASLYDWFEVVPPDGTVGREPTYRVALIVGDRGDPIIPS